MQDLQTNAANLPVRTSSSVSQLAAAGAVGSAFSSAGGAQPGPSALSPDVMGSVEVSSLAELQARMQRLRAAEN